MRELYHELNWNHEIVNMAIFQEKLLSAREKCIVDTDILSRNVEREYTLSELIDLKSGRISCIVDGIKFECLLQRKDSPRLYVLFNGALGERREEKIIPNFQRWSWGGHINANVLNIFDPMYLEYTALKIGWYYGDKKRDFRQCMAKMILKIAEELKVRNQDIVLYGSSAGGTAAFYTAMYIPKCTAVAINPQLRIWKHEWFTNFQKITGLGIEDLQTDMFHRNDIFYHIDHAWDNKFILLTNCQSRVDFNFQMIPISEHYGFVSRYGLTRFNNLYTWIFDNRALKSPHSAVDYLAVFSSIDFFITDLMDKYNDEELNGYARLINEFWRDHYDLIYENELLRERMK